MNAAVVHPYSTGRDFRAGLWRLADPRISLASIASLFLGTVVAAAEGPLHWGWLAVTVLGILAIEIAKNASGEIFDYDSGTDRLLSPADYTPFSGGKRVLVDGLLSRDQTAFIAGAGYGLGILAGMLIVMLREPRVLWLGVLGVACAWSYDAPPLKLAYRGLGETAVALCYGPLVAAGAYLVQRQALDIHVVLLAIPLGLLIAGFLWINEFPDYRADLRAGKRTLVVDLGRRLASVVFGVIIAVAFGLAALLPIAGTPVTVWAGLVAAIPAVQAARKLAREPESREAVVPAQVLMLLSFVLYALMAGLGFLAG